MISQIHNIVDVYLLTNPFLGSRRDHERKLFELQAKCMYRTDDMMELLTEKVKAAGYESYL